MSVQPRTQGPGWNRAQAMGVSPHPGIGGSVNYVQSMQGRNANFSTGASEGKSSTGGGGLMQGVKSIFGGGGGEAEAGAGDAAASGAAESAGMGLAEDAAIVAV